MVYEDDDAGDHDVMMKMLMMMAEMFERGMEDWRRIVEDYKEENTQKH